MYSMYVCTPFSYYRIRKHRKKRRGVDYNAEIPFEKKPAQGTVSSGIFKGINPRHVPKDDTCTVEITECVI